MTWNDLMMGPNLTFQPGGQLSKNIHVEDPCLHSKNQLHDRYQAPTKSPWSRWFRWCFRWLLLAMIVQECAGYIRIITVIATTSTSSNSNNNIFIMSIYHHKVSTLSETANRFDRMISILDSQFNLPIFSQEKNLIDLLSLWSSSWKLDNVNPRPSKILGREILLHFGLTFLITLWVRVVLANLRVTGMNSGHIIPVLGSINSLPWGWSSHLYEEILKMSI